MSTASSIEQEMLTLINAERTSRGLNPLQLETQLNDSSEDHSTWMLDTDMFSHTGSGGSSATQRMQAAGLDLEGNWRTGENIAWQSERGAPGISDDVAQLHQNLMNSPGHRANILNPDFDYIGIGIETGDMQGFDAVMVTQNFAATDAAVMLDNGNGPVPPAPTPPVEEVAEPEEPGTETPDTDVSEPEEPETETPDTDVAEPEEPTTETPDTDVAEPEEPTTETPDTDVAEPEEPTTETPDTDVTEPEEPGVEEPDSGCFDVAAFLAELEAFIEALQARFDQFDWEDDDMMPSDSDEGDMEVVMVEDTDPSDDAIDACSGTEGEDAGDIYVFNFYDSGCMMEAA
ncbi:CAP domain-containing protein [uncultured Ruegeria sp.]|uniref:CAP domain-containing protein n=1 Tax=uncultured Ruegeria sp. TaxID=259304 RepID=UPI00260D0D33|nr:CAP domain-containing protein [uncultured Ruegeria sp.]